MASLSAKCDHCCEGVSVDLQKQKKKENEKWFLYMYFKTFCGLCIERKMCAYCTVVRIFCVITMWESSCAQNVCVCGRANSLTAPYTVPAYCSSQLIINEKILPADGDRTDCLFGCFYQYAGFLYVFSNYLFWRNQLRVTIDQKWICALWEIYWNILVRQSALPCMNFPKQNW